MHDGGNQTKFCVATPCLFNILADPTEHNVPAASTPFLTMSRAFLNSSPTFYAPCAMLYEAPMFKW